MTTNAVDRHKLPVNIIHIEDDAFWREEIKRCVLQANSIQFREYVSVSSFEEIRYGIDKISGPTLIIIDLRLDDPQAPYMGYHWLLEESQSFSRRHADVAIFVISGQLHEGIVESLERRGIPTENLYEKIYWAEQRTAFIERLDGVFRDTIEHRQPSIAPAGTEQSDRTPIGLFYSYSHKDERFRLELEKHLSLLRHEGQIQEWHDRRISAGTEWAGAIASHLESANIILLLISADFLYSDYCYDVEMTRAMTRHAQGTARVIPVILRRVDWHSAPFGKLQALPDHGEPVSGGKWRTQDEAWASVVDGIRRVVREMRIDRSRPSTSK